MTMTLKTFTAQQATLKCRQCGVAPSASGVSGAGA